MSKMNLIKVAPAIAAAAAANRLNDASKNNHVSCWPVPYCTMILTPIRSARLDPPSSSPTRGISIFSPRDLTEESVRTINEGLGATSNQY